MLNENFKIEKTAKRKLKYLRSRLVKSPELSKGEKDYEKLLQKTAQSTGGYWGKGRPYAAENRYGRYRSALRRLRRGGWMVAEEIKEGDMTMNRSREMIEAVLDGFHPRDVVDELLEAEGKFRGKEIPKEIKLKMLQKAATRSKEFPTESPKGESRRKWGTIRRYHEYLKGARKKSGESRYRADLPGFEIERERRRGKQKSKLGPAYVSRVSSSGKTHYERPGEHATKKEREIVHARFFGDPKARMKKIKELEAKEARKRELSTKPLLSKAERRAKVGISLGY